MGVDPKNGGILPPKWMVYSENNGKPYEQMDDLGVPLFLETPKWVCLHFKYTTLVPHVESLLIFLLIGGLLKHLKISFT